MLIVALLAALVPTGLPLAGRLILRHTAKRLHKRSAHGGLLSFGEPHASARPILAQALRVNVAAGIAETIIVLASLVAFEKWHLAPAISWQQIVAVDLLALSLPVAALSFDHKLSRPLHSARKRLLDRATVASLAGFSMVVGALTYLNYLFFYVRHSLDAAYLDPALPLYREATTLSVATLTLCLLVYILFDRAHKHDKFFSFALLENSRLLQALGISVLLLLVAVYVSPLQHVLDTAALSVTDWVSALFVTLLYASFRLLQRHTRKHTRRAVITLHRQVRVQKV
jgi:magnesium-transporting ATPase (P-type)